MASSSILESQSPPTLAPAAIPPTSAPAKAPPSAPATAPPSPLSISAGNSPEIRGVVTMKDIKIYQRRQKEMPKEKVQLAAEKNWVPETPTKPVLVRPHSVYVKRRLKTNSRPSFMSRICKEEAESEARHDSTCLSSTSEFSTDLSLALPDGQENEKLHPVQTLEPTTPSLKQNKRSINCRDTNPRPVKKLKIKKKRHRPRVAVDVVFKRPIKKLCPKKEKVTLVKKTQPRGKRKKSIRKRLKMSNSEASTSTMENHVDLSLSSANHVDSSLSSASVLTLTVDGKIVGIMQSGSGTGDTGDHGRSNEKVLLASPELPSIHSIDHNVVMEPKVVCRYALRVRQAPKKEIDSQFMDSRGHEEASAKVEETETDVEETFDVEEASDVEELNFPTQCKWTRMKRKRRPKLSTILLYFQFKGYIKRFFGSKGYIKKKRSKRFMSKAKMAALQGKTLIDGTTKVMGERSVSNPSIELAIGEEEQGEVNRETYAPQSSEQGNYEGSQPTLTSEPTLSLYEILILKPFEALHLIDKPTGTEKAFNYEDNIVNKEEPCISRSGSVTGDSMMPRIRETSARAHHQDYLSMKAGPVVPYLGFPYPGKGALVTRQAFLSPKTRDIVIHRPRLKKIKPVIELDFETLRRWNQIKRIEDGLGEEEVEVDEETKSQWAKDRKIFRGRIKVFNNKLHLVHGDRKFRPWKGSVVDSVVGVYLTQNVSDNLSSSAYMSLAAKFPRKKMNQEAFNCSQESTGSSGGGTTEDLVGYQYFVTTYDEDEEEGLDDIEDIGNSTKSLIPSFQDFYQTMCSSSHVVPGSSNVGANSDNIDPTPKETKTKTGAEKEKEDKEQKEQKIDWDSFRRKYSRPRSSDHTDSIDWEAVRQADSSVIADTIKARGQHTVIAERIKDFLNRVLDLHGSIDLEWLRYAPDLGVKNYLLAIPGLGLKSVECIRLLALNRVAFPVDVNVARIAVRLGWVPLKPLPGDIQFHLLEEYPIMDHVQKYLMPRLIELDSETLYEFHYHLITFGKIFCKKRNPNCGACPMRPECKHYASAVAASANLSLPGPNNDDLGRSKVPSIPVIDCHPVSNSKIPMTLLEYEVTSELVLGNSNLTPSIEEPKLDCGLESCGCVPIIEEPKSPEFVQNLGDREGVNYGLESSVFVPTIEEPKSPEFVQESGDDCDNNNFDDKKLIDNEEEDDEIPTIQLSDEVFKKNVQYYMEKNLNNSSRALVPSLMDVNSSFVHKLKHAKHLRTEHEVYEIPDDHEILTGIERRDSDDIVPYLLAIWTAGETPNSVRQPEKKCNSEGSELCSDHTCFACESFREGKANIIRGTILIPCRTAMRARFPLNGTYFQVNEVFADHESSCNPLNIPRSLIWNLKRRTVFFGTSPSAIFTKGCSLREIQLNFWKGFICLRGFDRQTRGPKPLAPRFHCSPSKMEKTPRKVNPDKVKKTPPKPKSKLKPRQFDEEKPNDDPNKPQGATV
ncbi:demeter-like 1 [Euphorbia peplus]|nr:demeter-like 1 [Euphorbia peplus]